MLSVTNLSIGFSNNEQFSKVVHEISFELKEQEILGIVGESGSGKSVTSLAIMGLLPENAKISGKIELDGTDLTSLNKDELRQLRGKKMGMIFQEPMSSLNPSLTCGFQVIETLLLHTSLSKKEAKEEVIRLFNKVKLPRPEQIFKQYPHQISGGQKQRVMIAIAIACKPKVLIADEPTTALDVTVQKEIIELLKELQEETKMSIIFITHDLSLVSEIADQVVVMYQGNVVEKGTASEVFHHPKHNYSKALINSRPSLEKRLKRLPTVQDYLEKTIDFTEVTNTERVADHKELYVKEPILQVKDLATYFGGGSQFFFKKSAVVKAVNNVSFSLFQGETLGLVGESGCGKTTLGRTILQLEKATKGHIFYQGKDVTALTGAALKKFRREVQIIFQDPFASLNPRIPVGKAIMEPMKVHNIGKNRAERETYVKELLDKVGLEPEHFYRYPHEFSGGQRQRVGIARTIALRPKIIICDESVSALDVSVQAQVLNLLAELKETFGFTYIFISHDLAVVKYVSDHLIVMNQGRIEEMGDADFIYANPKSNYTKTLIEAIPKGI